MADVELVIKIPEESYIALMEIKDALQRSQGFEKFIVKGILLPKGHGRLIDYGYVVDAIDDWVNAEEYRYTNATDYLRKRVKNVPTIIEADNGDGNTWHDIPADEMSVSQLRAAVKDLRKKLVEVIQDGDSN